MMNKLTAAPAAWQRAASNHRQSSLSLNSPYLEYSEAQNTPFHNGRGLSPNNSGATQRNLFRKAALSLREHRRTTHLKKDQGGFWKTFESEFYEPSMPTSHGTGGIVDMVNHGKIFVTSITLLQDTSETRPFEPTSITAPKVKPVHGTMSSSHNPQNPYFIPTHQATAFTAWIFYERLPTV